MYHTLTYDDVERRLEPLLSLFFKKIEILEWLFHRIKEYYEVLLAISDDFVDVPSGLVSNQRRISPTHSRDMSGSNCLSPNGFQAHQDICEEGEIEDEEMEEEGKIQKRKSMQRTKQKRLRLQYTDRVQLSVAEGKV